MCVTLFNCNVFHAGADLGAGEFNRIFSGKEHFMLKILRRGRWGKFILSENRSKQLHKYFLYKTLYKTTINNACHIC